MKEDDVMSELYSSICITTVRETVQKLFGIDCAGSVNPVNKPLIDLAKAKLADKAADRAVLYNPDAVALWLYQKYTDKFTKAMLCSDIAVPMLSVMPSVTPVCFASMYSGVMPETHGIKKYEKPVLTVETIFDTLIKNGLKCAIVSTEGDSISKIFLEREMDYFIYDSIDEVNKKALELIDEDNYSLIVIYNGNYDSRMHKFSPESVEALAELDANIDFYSTLVEKIKAQWKHHNTIYGFLPDHGCHAIDGDCGSHGLDMQEDMNVIHFYGINKAD